VANHQHSIATQGGDDPHNNMQPTLFIGNMFIYSGKIHGPTSKWRYEIDTNIL
jgi:microcystin-dependent protein